MAIEKSNLETQHHSSFLDIVISRLKSIRKFNLVNYREGEYGIDTEREYESNGDYIDSYEIDVLICELESGL